jgi:hypothetical protein
MAKLIYGGVELKLLWCDEVKVEPVHDPSGTDTLYLKVSLNVLFEWNPFATASTPNVLVANGNAPNAPGDALGLSIRNLKDTLCTDRLPLKYSVGNDVVFQAPELNQFGQPFDCDVGNGPLAGPVSVFNLCGEKSAQGRWKVTFFVPLGDNILLSNRWTVEATTNAAGFTTRVISGAATVRADWVDSGGDAGPAVNVDSMRKWLFCPVPFGFRRDKVRVLVDEKQVNARYTVTDIQIANPLGVTGGGCGAVKVTGMATAGSKSKFTGHGLHAQQTADAVLGNFSIFDSWPTFADKLVDYAHRESVLNVQTASAMVRVTGNQNAQKSQLARLATLIALQYFQHGHPISAELTTGIGDAENDGRFAEVRMLFQNSVSSALGSTLNIFDFDSQMKLANSIQVNDPFLINAVFPGDTATSDPKYQSFNLPNDSAGSVYSGTRGNWLGALLGAALQDVGEPPNAPPANTTTTTANLV